MFNDKYFASGILIFNSYMFRKNKPIHKIIPFFTKYHEKLIYPDQDFLNYVFYDNVTYLPLNLCVNYKLYSRMAIDRYMNIHLTKYTQEDINDALTHPVVIHFTGEKPDVQISSPDIWYEYCQKAGLVDEYRARIRNIQLKSALPHGSPT
jgi:lipopolysaccharide biosynthesis glycosyltransferase